MTRQQKSLAFTLLVAALALTAALAGCSGGDSMTAHAQEGPPPAPPVSVAQVVSRAVVEQRDFSGRIEAVESAQIRARVPGTIEAVRFEPGTLVKKGEVLFAIDSRSYEAEAQRAKAAVAGSRARAELALSELDRAKRLLADNAIAQRAFDERAATARQLEAAARADEAALAAATLNLEHAMVRAPFSGRVGKAEVTRGNLVDSSVVLTTLVSVDPVYVSFTSDEATFLRLGSSARGDKAATVRMGLANETGYPHEGRLGFVDNRVDPSSGTVRMRAVMRNPDGALTPGLFARVQVGTGAAGGESLLINEMAVGTDQDRKYVYVVNAENKAEYRVVELGPVVDGLRVARKGLKAGERIVVNGLQRVRPGAPVQPEVVPMLAGEGAVVTTTASAR